MPTIRADFSKAVVKMTKADVVKSLKEKAGLSTLYTPDEVYNGIHLIKDEPDPRKGEVKKAA